MAPEGAFVSNLAPRGEKSYPLVLAVLMMMCVFVLMAVLVFMTVSRFMAVVMTIRTRMAVIMSLRLPQHDAGHKLARPQS